MAREVGQERADGKSNDADPIGRFEDVLLDRDVKAADRGEALRFLAEDDGAAERAADRHFAHGLLVTNNERGAAKRSERFRSAIEKVKFETTTREERLASISPMYRYRMVAAAAIIIGLGVGVWTFFRAANVDKGDSGAPPVVAEFLPPKYDVVSGDVRQEKSGDAAWLLSPMGDVGAAVRFNGRLAVLAPKTTIMVNSGGDSFHLLAGEMSLEGDSMRAKVGDWHGVLSGGPLVMSNESGGMADLYSGVVSGVGGDSLLAAGHTYSGSTGKAIPLSIGLLPEWVAAGRADDVFRELNTLADGGLAEQRDAWIETLRPMLAEPVTRSVVLAASRELLAAELTNDETREVLSLIGAVLDVIRKKAEAEGYDYEERVTVLCAQIAKFERELKPEAKAMHAMNRRMFLDHWRTRSAEERAAMRSQVLKMLEMMQGRRPKAGDAESGGE